MKLLFITEQIILLWPYTYKYQLSLYWWLKLEKFDCALSMKSCSSRATRIMLGGPGQREPKTFTLMLFWAYAGQATPLFCSCIAPPLKSRIYEQKYYYCPLSRLSLKLAQGDVFNWAYSKLHRIKQSGCHTTKARIIITIQKLAQSSNII